MQTQKPFGIGRLIEAGLPLGPLAEPTPLWGASRSGKVHLSWHCVRSGGAVEVPVVLTELDADRICKACSSQMSRGAISRSSLEPLRYIDEAIVLHRRACRLDELDEQTQDSWLTPEELAEVRGNLAATTNYDDEFGEYLGELRASVVAKRSDLLSTRVSPNAGAPALRYAVAYGLHRDFGSHHDLPGLAEDSNLNKLVDSSAHHYNAPLLGAWKQFLTALRAGATSVDAAGESLSALSEWARFHDRVSLLPETPRLAGADFGSVADWARAEWEADIAHQSFALVCTWAEEVERLAAETAESAPTVLSVVTSWSNCGPDAKVADLLAPFPREVCTERRALYLVPEPVAQVVSRLDQQNAQTGGTLLADDPTAALEMIAGLWDPSSDDALSDLGEAVKAAVAVGV